MAPVDILRRGGVDIKTVSVTGTEWVETSHGVTIKADLKFEDITSFGGQCDRRRSAAGGPECQEVQT